MIFYPEDENVLGTIDEKLDILMAAAEQYKTYLLGALEEKNALPELSDKKIMMPRDIQHAYQWDFLAKMLREIRDIPEATASAKTKKMTYLEKLATIYEVLRSAKMPKLEAVRLAIMNEADQLKPV